LIAAIDPVAVIALTSDGNIHVREIAPKLGMHLAIDLPPPLSMQGSPLVMSLMQVCPPSLIEDLRKTCNIAWNNANNVRKEQFQPFLIVTYSSTLDLALFWRAIPKSSSPYV